MAGSSGHWLLAASLLGVLSAPAPVSAQAERAWVDPPAENAATSPAAAPAPAAPAPQAPPPPPQAAAPAPEPSSASTQAASDKPKVERSSPSRASPRKEAASETAKKEQIKKSTAARKVGISEQTSRKAARTQKREGQTARRHEPNSEVSEVRPPRNGIERRARITRYGSIQEGVDAGLEVMRLRTIQLPAGRRIDILTRPDQDLASELPDGY